jgi:hypothetical protein
MENASERGVREERAGVITEAKSGCPGRSRGADMGIWVV